MVFLICCETHFANMRDTQKRVNTVAPFFVHLPTALFHTSTLSGTREKTNQTLFHSVLELRNNLDKHKRSESAVPKITLNMHQALLVLPRSSIPVSSGARGGGGKHA